MHFHEEDEEERLIQEEYDYMEQQRLEAEEEEEQIRQEEYDYMEQQQSEEEEKQARQEYDDCVDIIFNNNYCDSDDAEDDGENYSYDDYKININNDSDDNLDVDNGDENDIVDNDELLKLTTMLSPS
jgi:hypothetical protein